jgi:hypothetical protein
MNPPLDYEDAASLQAHFKHLTEAEAEKLARLKTRPFGPESKETFLCWYSKGFSVKDCLAHPGPALDPVPVGAFASFAGAIYPTFGDVHVVELRSSFRIPEDRG